MVRTIDALRGPQQVVVEGVGGLMVPLTPSRQTVLDLLVRARLPALIVTRPHLGTLNHTALTVLAARSRGLPLIGLVINAAQPCPAGLATARVSEELSAITGLPVLLEIGFDPHGAADRSQAAGRLAAAVCAWQHRASCEADGP
jgi:dethiobiotin synthetase